jgi:AcrR family transcriptional regulator
MRMTYARAYGLRRRSDTPKLLRVSTEIPRTLKVLWEPTRPGPKQALSLDRIVAAAIRIADQDGLTALSMARLAQELGSAPMSLYRHVANKDELLVFMQDAAPGPPPPVPTGWRDGLATWARALRGVYYAHPWILQVRSGRPPLDPGQLAWLDRGLGALEGTSLTVQQRLDAVMTLLHYVRGEAHVMAILLDGQDAFGDYGELLTRFVRPERFPSLAAALASGLFETPDEDSFERGLTTVLDGIGLSMKS